MLNITNDDCNALLYLYYSIDEVLKTSKGLKYKSAFQAMQNIKNLKSYIKTHNIKVEDYIMVGDDNIEH